MTSGKSKKRKKNMENGKGRIEVKTRWKFLEWLQLNVSIS